MAVSINTGGTYSLVTRATGADADAITGWSAIKIEGGGGGPSVLQSVGTIDSVAQGTNAIATRTNKQRVELRFSPGTTYDFTSGSTGSGTVKVPDGTVYVWSLFLAAGALFTKAAGGMQIALTSGANTNYYNVAGSDTYSGGFYKWAIKTTFAASENSGTAADLGNIDAIGFVTDVGGATTRFDNFVVDAIDIGSGLTFQGTTDNDALFSEITTLNATNANAFGILSQTNGIFFAQGDLELSGTAMTSIGETLVFSDTVRGTDTAAGTQTYALDITGTVTLTNSSIRGSGDANFAFDTSGASSFTMNGGGLDSFATLTTAAGQTFDGVVFANGGTSTVANTVTNSTFTGCGKATITGTLSNCSVTGSTAAEATSVSTLTKVSNCTFTRGTTTSHAVELTGAAGSYNWTGKLTGYDAGSTGNGVQVTGGSITGNEAIHITATTGTFNIAVADGADTPSVSTAGAVVNVTAGGATFAATISPVPTPNYEWRLYTVTAVGSLDGAAEIDGAENETGGSINYPHTYTNQPAALQVISNDYVESITYYTLNSNDINTTIDLQVDNND